jgi:hypothetical protein
MVQATPLLLGALLVGALHMSAPDDWVTLYLLGKVAKWTRDKLLLMSLRSRRRTIHAADESNF